MADACMQLVYGIERVVDMSIAKVFPPAAYATTFIVRFANNVFGE
jgi:branched-subunit amino acid ABC-type transport system permease component